MSILTMWNAIRAEGYSEAGTAGILGNLKAESLLAPNNLQDSYEAKLGHTDESYSAAVDNGTYSKDRFIHDAAGYGLAQWTYYSRKQGLYEYCKGKGVSIYDESAQIEYLLQEMKGYVGLSSFLKTTDNVDEASDRVCREFEQPAVNNYAIRRRYSHDIFDTMKGAQITEKVEDTRGTPPTIKLGSKGLIVGMAQLCLIRKGYSLGTYGKDTDGCDCDFGPATQAAVEAFQRTQGLNTTGVVDAETWRRLWR